MGSLSSRPKKPRNEWKPHSTLQAAMEMLEKLISSGEVTGRKVDGKYRLTVNGRSATADTLCESMLRLSQ